MTLDEYNRYWIGQASTARDLEELAQSVSAAMCSRHWNGKLAKHVCGIMVRLRVEDGPCCRVDSDPQKV